MKTTLSQKYDIFKKNPEVAEPSSTSTEENRPYGEDVKTVRQYKLNCKLLTPAEKDEAIAKYKGSLNMTAIADEYGCHYTTIGRLLRQRGVAVRD